MSAHVSTRPRGRRLARAAAAALTALTALVALAAASAPAGAQYFGRNKVNYETFDFRILATPRFDVHYYPEIAEASRDAGRMAERWYARLSPFLRTRSGGGR
jgi:hypothetical protein